MLLKSTSAAADVSLPAARCRGAGRSKAERSARRWALLEEQQKPMLWLSAPIGLETGVRAEVAEKLGLPQSVLVRHQGKVLAPILDKTTGEPVVAPAAFATLRTPELMYAAVVVAQLDGVEGTASTASAERSLPPISKELALSTVQATVAAVPKSVWARAASMRLPTDSDVPNACDGQTTFYVERHRGGQHSFSGVELCQTVACAVASTTGWEPELHNATLTLMCHLHHNELFVGVRLSDSCAWMTSGAARAKETWTNCTIQPNVAHALLRMCNLPKSNDGSGALLVDPCCGNGTTPLVVADEPSWRSTFCLAGDMDPTVLENTRTNLLALQNYQQQSNGLAGKSKRSSCRSLPPGCDLVLWNSTNLPLRSGIVDRVVSDLPFGKRCGSKQQAATLYPRILREGTRITRAGRSDTQMVLLGAVGPACSLLNSPERWQWAVRAQVRMSLGGLDGMILHLSRRTAHTDAAANAVQTHEKAAEASPSPEPEKQAECKHDNVAEL